MEEIVEVPAWHWIRIELIQSVVFTKQLHADHSEYVDHNHQDEGQITERADRRNDDTEENLHGRPRLSKLQNA